MKLQRLVFWAYFLSCLLGVVCGRAENTTAKPDEAATNWLIDELPKPDSDGWIHLFDGDRLCGSIPQSSDSQPGNVQMDGGLLRVDSAIVQFNLDCNDLEFRARLKKTSGRYVKITIRNIARPVWQGCATFFAGDDKFFTEKIDDKEALDLISTNAPGPYDNFFDLDITAIGDNLTLKANGKVVYSIQGSSVGYGGIRIYSDRGTTLFKDIQVKILDKGPTPRDRLVDAVEANFTHWDKNHNGDLDESEINTVLQDPYVKGDAAAAAATLKGQFAEMNRDAAPALTARFFQSDDSRLEMLASEFQMCLKRLQNASGLPIFSQDSPSLAECGQRRLEDCYLIAPLGARLARNPAVIHEMITPDDQIGGYHVFFPDGTRVDTPRLTEGELAWLGAGPAKCLWQRTLEKAWGLRKVCRKYGTPDPSIDPFDFIPVGGGSGENMLLSLTGHNTADYYLGKNGHTRTPVPKLRNALQGAIQSGRLVEAFTWDVSNSRLPPDHAFAVLGYDSTTDLIKLWNPWGNNFVPHDVPGPMNGYRTVDGKFEMPLTEFIKIFAQVRAETDQPAKMKGPMVFPAEVAKGTQ